MLCHLFWSQVEYKIVCFTSKQPSLEEFNEVLSSLQQPLSWDVGEPLGSATRILAGLFNTVTKSCRKICLDTLRDDRTKQAFEGVPSIRGCLVWGGFRCCPYRN